MMILIGIFLAVSGLFLCWKHREIDQAKTEADREVLGKHAGVFSKPARKGALAVGIILFLIGGVMILGEVFFA